MAPRRDNRLARGLLAIAAPVLVAAARDSICHKVRRRADRPRAGSPTDLPAAGLPPPGPRAEAYSYEYD